MMKVKEFRVTELDLVTKKQPLTDFVTARLFYGVPRWAKWVHRDIKTFDLIFTNKRSY